MQIEKSDVEWFITLVVMILLAFFNLGNSEKKISRQKETQKEKKTQQNFFVNFKG